MLPVAETLIVRSILSFSAAMTILPLKGPVARSEAATMHPASMACPEVVIDGPLGGGADP
jgi:hypothetical protein